jgi:glycosyltransferase involved in cell wall biosynthesis
MHARVQSLPSCLVVVNANFVPRGPNGPFPYGGAYFVAEVARELAALGAFSGFLLYQRDESLADPILDEESLWGWPVYRLRFHFGHPPERISSLIAGSVRKATARLGANRPNRRVICYHQTGALLPYAGDAPAIVTHHGPFVRDVVGLLGRDMAVAAFGGGTSKLDALQHLQDDGVQRLVQARSVRALEISSVQAHSLLEAGVPGHRLTNAAPLVRVAEHAPHRPPAAVANFLAEHPGRRIFLTAVARLDAFKNVELLVDAIANLSADDQPVVGIIIGGPKADDAGRQRLMQRIPPDLRHGFLILPRLDRDDLHSAFRATREAGLFVCTSRFETLGITGLEAMCCGLPVAVTDLPRWIGLADYVPREFRFEPTISSLTDFLASMTSNPSRLRRAREAADRTRSRVNGEEFHRDLVRNLEMLVQRQGVEHWI